MFQNKKEALQVLKTLEDEITRLEDLFDGLDEEVVSKLEDAGTAVASCRKTVKEEWLDE